MINEIIVNGFLNGLIYALLSLGFTLIYGYSGLLNLAHGAFFVIGAYIFSSLASLLYLSMIFGHSYLPVTISLILTPLLTGLIGAAYYKVTLSPLIGDELSILIVSSSACIIFQQILWLIFGSVKAMQFSVPPIVEGNTSILGVHVSNNLLVSAALSTVLFILMSLFISKTKIGRSMKALSQDVEAAMLMGVNRERIYTLTVFLSGVLASLGGIFITCSTSRFTSVYGWLEPLAISYAIVILGGIGNIIGTIFGGLLFGYATTIVSRLFPRGGALVPAVPFFILIFILIIRPKGLLGKRVEME